MKKFTIAAIIIDILVAICFFVTYGVESFRNTIIMTSLNTKTHQYIAYTFYSEETIRAVQALDTFTPINEEVDLDDIVIDTEIRDTFDNEYDEQILTRDEGNNDYKYLKIKVGGYDAHLTAIYDPSKVKLIHSKTFNTGTGQESIPAMCNRYGGLVCVNGGMFVDNGLGSDIPMGYLIKDGKTIWADHDGPSSLIGFNKDNKLMLINATAEEAIKKGMKDALEFGPFLIVNGKAIEFNGSVGGYSRAARVAVAQRKDGVVLFLVTEGTHALGPNIGELIETLQKYGAYNAVILEGGPLQVYAIKEK